MTILDRYGKAIVIKNLQLALMQADDNRCIRPFNKPREQHEESQLYREDIYQQLLKLFEMEQYIVLETHGGATYAIVVSDEDGNNKVFDSREAAEAEAADCQAGIVVAI